MRFANLRYFARTAAGTLDPQAVHALKFPMPEDVLEQFVVDHSLSHEFQDKYADLDLYGIAWAIVDLPVPQITACTSKFDDYVDEVAAIIRENVAERPLPHMSAESSAAWFNSGTWLRSPVFLEAVVLGSSTLHLVEGHTRVGVLKGLLDMSVPVRTNHRCWVGRKSPAPVGFDWVEALEDYPLSFRSWLFEAIGEKCSRGQVASKLLESESRLRYTHSFPPTFDGLRDLAAADVKSQVSGEDLSELRQTWRDELEHVAGRRLRLSP